MKTRPQIVVLPYTRQLRVLYTIIRDQRTLPRDFIFYADRIIRLLVEEALNLLPVLPRKIVTPTGRRFAGARFEGGICAVSIVRAGEAMEKAVREVCQSIRIGKILIQRDERTAIPRLFYAKLPDNIRRRKVLLLDPMLATGGSACQAITVLKRHGVREKNIIFINLIACPEGLQRVRKEAPAVRIVTGFVDAKLNRRAFILPGLGDFGDRYFRTA